ncbi:MAG: alpha/beta hydrolase [Betaproteobacteria bacterium]|nr:alpha/beta hydrolase [Betaproteobacteria bacterium]
MPFATINGVRINYQIQGSGPYLLMFAPGGFRSVISRWTAQGGKEAWKEMDGLATLSRHFTTIAYDRRESGQSGGRVEPLTWDLYVQEAKALLDLAGAKQAYILGCCMGASLALAFAVRHPGACKGLLLHWPVGGYRWMMKGNTFFKRHMDFVRAEGLAAVVKRAPLGENFWLDPEIGPWGSPCALYPEFAAQLVRQDVDHYLDICARSRDVLFNDTMPSGASGAELMQIQIPALIMSGHDASHAVSASWALRELMPQSELWDVLPPHQNGENTLEQVLGFKARLETTAQAA